MTLYNIHPHHHHRSSKKNFYTRGCNVVDYGYGDDGDGVIGNYSGGGSSSGGGGK
jgi:hypothetical protein